MKELEIQETKATEIAIPNKITLYCCVAFNSNGVIMTNAPSIDKQYQEQYSYGMAKHDCNVSIYKFEVDAPNTHKL
jgi:hypothetical protein